MTKQSAFSGLKLSSQGQPTEGPVDQRLFGPLPARAKADGLATTKQRSNVAALSRNNEGTRGRLQEPTPVPENGLASEPKVMHTLAVPGHRERDRGRARARVAATPDVRIIERHSHDIFQDQVRWMNRVKLDLEERYGARVTGNAIVQLALDLFRDDFQLQGEESNLIRVLVRGYRWRSTAQDADDAEEGGETP